MCIRDRYGDSLWELSIESPEISEIALDLNLVDGIVTREELRHWMFQEFPNKKNDKNNYPDSISIYEYLSTIEDKKDTSKNKIAVVKATTDKWPAILWAAIGFFA